MPDPECLREHVSSLLEEPSDDDVFDRLAALARAATGSDAAALAILADAPVPWSDTEQRLLRRFAALAGAALERLEQARIEAEAAHVVVERYRALLEISTGSHAIETPAGSPRPRTVPPPQTFGAATVLVVEDEEGVRAVARKTLLLRGYTVMEAEGGSDALELAQAYAGTIDLLLTDVVMPGMNGPRLAAELRRDRPGMRVIFMSGYTAGVSLELDDSDAAGIPFIAKPFTPATLASAVSRALDGEN